MFCLVESLCSFRSHLLTWCKTSQKCSFFLFVSSCFFLPAASSAVMNWELRGERLHKRKKNIYTTHEKLGVLDFQVNFIENVKKKKKGSCCSDILTSLSFCDSPSLSESLSNLLMTLWAQWTVSSDNSLSEASTWPSIDVVLVSWRQNVNSKMKMTVSI